jgi:hypothetical protein
MRCVGLVFAVALCMSPLSAAGQQQQPTEWAKLPRMQLERQFGGPLQDTIIQRWRDPVDRTIGTGPEARPTRVVPDKSPG